MRIRLRRIAAVARHDFRLLRREPAFLAVVTIAPLGFMAFSERSIGLVLRAQEGDPTLSGAAYVVPAGVVLFGGFMVGNMSFWIFREHGWGTWERLRATEMTATDLMAGKAVVPILSLTLQITTLLVAGIVAFDLKINGSVVAFVLVAMALVAVQISLGYLLLSVCRSVMQLDAVTNAGSMVFGGLGGAVAPVALLPGWAQALAPLTPAYWAIKGFTTVTMDGGGLSDVARPVAVLAAFALVFGAVAVLRFDVGSAKVARR